MGRMRAILTYGFFIILALGGGTLIGIFNIPGDWYQSLVKPSFNPPNWIFGPAWTVLYIMIGVAGARVFIKMPRSPLMGIWALQMALNFLWSPVFFTLHRPDLALIVIGLLLASILAFITLAARHDRIAALLFIPYALWVSFATLLNSAIVALN